MPPRVLVLSASVGAGHLRAAEAVAAALERLAPSVEVRNVDVLELTNAAFRRFYGRAYLDLVNRAPYVLGYLYDLMDRPRSSARKSDRLRLALERINLARFVEFLRRSEAEVIVNTHFLPAEIIAALKSRGEICVPQMTVTTDFETHRLWVNQPCEHYFTATDEGAEYLAHFGVPREHITVSGIPIHPVFAEPHDRAACLARQGLAGDRPIVLQLAGGFGVGPVERLLEAILGCRRPIEAVVVCGRNESLRGRLEAVAPPERHRLKIVGFTTEIDQLMAVADVVVSKPGGLTSSEVLASGAAMLIVNPIPGQESRNSDYLLEHGAALKVNTTPTLRWKLDALLADTDRLAELKRRAARLARPDAALVVARAALARRGRRAGAPGPGAGAPEGAAKGDATGHESA